MSEFVGKRWAFPMGVDANGRIALAGGHEGIEQAMSLVLLTYPGERPMRPDFGCRLKDFVFSSIDGEMITELTMEVRQSLLRWEPRIDVMDVVVRPDPRQHTLVHIDVEYRVKETNDHRNLVFPFYTIPDDGSDY
ncbi:baseplate protein [Lentzea aerocolonigenes]|uniref:Baseplate protein n=1 Tax=Lentzea aerocolonigenes TaxID=68170 RepID=A0A0F0H113_LENAE|nr:baseplate protein [Lentzea aerocolonigenes]